jgi:hypothetical protein
MDGTTTPPTPDPSHHGDGRAKRPKRIRKDGPAARDEAFQRLHACRHFYIRRLQHEALSHLLSHGELFAPDLTDRLTVPPEMRKVFVGAAINELSRRRLIRKAPSSPRYTTQGGRHGHYVEVWVLDADAARVAEWMAAHPVPPQPEPTEGGS